MKHYELLHECARVLESYPEYAPMQFLTLIHPHNNGRFPFAGGKTEKLNETTETAAYAVPIHQILNKLARALKELE